MGFVFLVVLALVLGFIWINMGRTRAGRGPDRPTPRRRRGGLELVEDMELASEIIPDFPVGSTEEESKDELDDGVTREKRDGDGPEEEPDFPVEQPEAQDDLTDIPNGAMPVGKSGSPEAAGIEPSVIFEAAFEVGEELVTFHPDVTAGWPTPEGEPPLADWSLLDEHDDLPASYGEDLVVAIVRNPNSLYVYWERSGRGEERLRQMLGDQLYNSTIPCLRVFDTGGAGSFTIDLSERDDHWFVHGLQPRHRYVISYERRSPDGRYYLLSLSNPVTTPEERAATSGLLYERLERFTGRQPTSGWR